MPPRSEATRAVEKEDFEAAMRAMASLRPHVDAFFDKVTVNVDDKPLRENRLKLLNEIRAATRAVADFSKIEGMTAPTSFQRCAGEGAFERTVARFARLCAGHPRLCARDA